MSTVNVTNLKHPSSSTNNIVLASDGSCSISNLTTAGLTYLGSATLSGTSTSLTGIPDTATMVVVTWENVSDTAGNSVRIRVNNTSGAVTSGYETSDGYEGGGSNSSQYSRSDAFDFGGAGMGSTTYDGRLTLTRLNNGNRNWYGEGTERQSGSSIYQFQTIGSVDCGSSQRLYGVTFLCPASFDAGVIYIHYM